MSLREEFENPAAQGEFLAFVRTSQIIWAALLIGPLAFAGVIAFLALREPQAGVIGFVTLAMAAFAVAAVGARFVIPDLLANQQVQAIAQGKPIARPEGAAMAQTQWGRLGMVYQMRLIIASALLDGATFANLCAVMLEKNLVALAISVVLWLGLAVGMPTASRALDWAERQLRRVHEMQSMK